MRNRPSRKSNATKSKATFRKFRRSFALLLLVILLCFIGPAPVFASEDVLEPPSAPATEPSPTTPAVNEDPVVYEQVPPSDATEPELPLQGEATKEGDQLSDESGEELSASNLDEASLLSGEIGILALAIGEEFVVNGLNYRVTAIPTPLEPGTVSLVGNEGLFQNISVPTSVVDPEAPADVYKVTGVALTSTSVGASSISRLICNNVGITSLDLSGCQSMIFLDCSNNPLGTLDISALGNLVFLACSFTGLTSIDLSTTPLIQRLVISNNILSVLDVTTLPALQLLDCSVNWLGSLDLTGNPSLQALNCADNTLTGLDLSGNPGILSVVCDENSLYDITLSPSASVPAVSGTVQFMEIPMKVLPDGSYVSLQAYPIQAGHIFSQTNVEVTYDSATGFFRSTGEMPQDVPFTTTLSSGTTIQGQITLVVETYYGEFVDWDGTSLKYDIYLCGEAATPPPNPTRAGYTFAGWNCDFSSIEENTTITAQYTTNDDPTPSPSPTPPPTPTDSQGAASGQMPNTGDILPMYAALVSILLAGALVVTFLALRKRKN